METKVSNKEALCQELRELLKEWDVVTLRQSNLEKDYIRLRNRILLICKMLDEVAQ